MRRLIVILAIAAAVILVLLLVVASFFNVNKFRPRIQAELQSKLNRPVTLGELHLRWIPFGIKVDGLTIGEPPAFASAPPFATAKEVSVRASLISIIRGDPRIEDLTLQDPNIELIQNTSGVWNFSDIGSGNPPGSPAPAANPGNKPPPAAQENAKASGQPANFSLNHLTIVNGQVSLTNQRTKSPRTVYNHIDLTLTDFAPGKQFDIAAQIHFPGPGTELVSFNGKAGPLATSGAQATPVSGQLRVEQVSLAGINSVAAGTIPPNSDASASGVATISSQNGTIAAKGNLDLQNTTVRGAKLNYPVNTQYDLTLNQNTNQIGVQNMTVKAGPTAISLAGAINNAVTPSNVNLRLTTNNASIPELMQLASLVGGSSSTSAQINGNISADLTATGSMQNPHVQGNVSSNSIQAQDLVLSNVHAAVKMDNGVAQLAPVTAGIFGGQENGTISVDTKAAHPPCSINMQLTGVDTNALLSAVSSVKNVLYGSLASQANVNFLLDSSTNLAGTLNGTVNFNVTNGKLKNVNILNEVAKVGKFLNAAPVQSASGTDLKKFSGTLNISRGVATTNNLVAELPQGTLSATGSLNLVNQGINMRMTAVLANSLSGAVGGTQVGGYLNTALANNKGELVVPVLVTGTTDHPVITPDVQAMAQMKLKHLLPSTSNPGGLLNSILGQQGQQGQKNQPQNPVKSLLNSLGQKH
jgi:AsmA protein